MEIKFAIAHNISHSKGWGRYAADVNGTHLVTSSTGNVWVSSPHSAETSEGVKINVTLQTMERVGKRERSREQIESSQYALVARQGARAELGHWNGLQVIVDGAELA